MNTGERRKYGATACSRRIASAVIRATVHSTTRASLKSIIEQQPKLGHSHRTAHLVVVRTGFGTAGYPAKPPAVQLAGEAGELGRLEVLGQDLVRERFLLVDDESVAVGEPAYHVLVFFVAQYVHQLFGYDEFGWWVGSNNEQIDEGTC